MNAHLHEPGVLDATELSLACGLTLEEINELLDYGVLQFCVSREGPEGFDAGALWPLREAARQRAIFDLDIFTMGLLVDYLRTIEELQAQLRALHARLPDSPSLRT
ncbi:MAG: hypothetical protein V4669_02190 [Pseudomonadota bacterium]